MKTLATFVALLGIVAMFTQQAEAQCCQPTVTYYAPQTTYYAPQTTYYAPPTTTYYAPQTTYYAPAVVPHTTYYAPQTTYYAPAAVPITSYYAPAAGYYARPGLFGWRWRSMRRSHWQTQNAVSIQPMPY